MALTKVYQVVERTELVLNDESAVRWTRIEIQNWMNDFYKELVSVRPDANALSATVTLAAGIRQKLTDSGSINLTSAMRVLDVVRNMAATSNKRSIRIIERNILDDTMPAWPAATSSVNIIHWMFDERNPKEFLVYPPATSLAQVELVYSSVPTAHALTEAQLDPAAVNAATINCDDVYANAMLDYILYRAYSKDADFAANGQRAINHYQAMNASLGVKTSVDVAMAPATATPRTGRGG